MGALRKRTRKKIVGVGEVDVGPAVAIAVAAVPVAAANQTRTKYSKSRKRKIHRSTRHSRRNSDSGARAGHRGAMLT